MEKETIIFLINNLICFMCPGYISIKFFMFLEGKGVSLNKDTIIKSVVISSVYCYLYFSLRYGTSKDIEMTERFNWNVVEIIVIYAVSVIFPFILYKVIRCKKLPKALKFLNIQSRLYDDCYSRVFDGSEAVKCIAYLKDSNIAYKGTVKFYSHDSKQIYINNYTRLIRHGDKYKADVDNDYKEDVKMVIFDINMLERLELAKKKINVSVEPQNTHPLTGCPLVDNPK